MMNLKTAFSLTVVLTLTFAAGLHASSDEEYDSGSVVTSVGNLVLDEDQSDEAGDTENESTTVAGLFDHIFDDMKAQKKAEIDLVNKAIELQTEQKQQEQFVVEEKTNVLNEESREMLQLVESCLDEIANQGKQQESLVKKAFMPDTRHNNSEVSDEDEE